MIVDNSWTNVFAPASIGNFGPGFDVLGAAIAGRGDIVGVRKKASRGIELIDCPDDLPKGDKNTAVAAAKAASRLLELDFGLELRLEKGLPIGSGLGSSGTSAVAAAKAVNILVGNKLSDQQMIDCAAEAEGVACGTAHHDNVAASLLGGVVLISTHGALRIETELTLHLALVTPAQSLTTERSRQAIPAAIPLAEVIDNSARLAQLIYALSANRLDLLSGAFGDKIATPRRIDLITGGRAALEAAHRIGTLGAAISGGGPTLFAACESIEQATAAAEAMQAAVLLEGSHGAQMHVCTLDRQGARRVD
ncbi:MAG: homoserine kinase [Deltaproteobacteria bacterium]|nr:homoserine kinase [Deltaproteobacteria bacterium]